MDDDERLYPAENFSESNTDDDEIDSDLEDQLYAAVFHSNDVSSRSDVIAGYNNFTSLTDVIGSWKNIQKENNEDSLSSEKTFDCNDKSYAENLEPVKITDCNEKSDFIKENRYDDERRENYEIRNRVEKEWGKNSYGKITGNQECPGNNKDRDASNDNHLGIDLYGEEESTSEPEIIREITLIDKRLGNSCDIGGKKSSGTQIMKKQRNSPKKLSKPKESQAENSSPKPLASGETDYDSHSKAENNSRNNSAIVSVPEDVTESSEIKAEEEIENNEPMGKERRISSLSNETCVLEENLDRPPSIKPEEELESTQEFVQAVEKRSEEIAAVKSAEEELGKINSMENEASNSSSNSSSSDSSSRDSSSSSSDRNTLDKTGDERNQENLPIENTGAEIITVEDSEGSIYEVPVPPKPRPLTIDLDDTESSTSSDEDTEIMTPEKLVQSYKIAVSESNSNSRIRRTGVRVESTPQKKRAQNRQVYSPISNSDDSMTESEEENWGIIAGSQTHRDKLTASSSTLVGRSEFVDSSTAGIEQRNSSGPIIEPEDIRTDLVSDEGENTIRESQKESLTGSSEIMEKTSGDLPSGNSLAVEKESVEDERLSQTRERSGENKEREKGLANDQNSVDEDTLIINAGSIRGLSDTEETTEVETSTGISETRKRRINDGGKKSKNQKSPKKSKTSHDSATASGSTSNKSRSEDKRRNRAADYFFKPMNSEMENYYNQSWGGENFDIETIRKQMPRDPRHWAILNEDLLSYQQRRSRYWTESKCRNCNHTGHHVAECPEKRKLPSCHMCGTSGHKEPRCPHKMCLGCGKKQKTYMQVCNGCRRAWCNRCQSYGHTEDRCPDLWRRYHVTTSHRDEITDLNQTDVMKPQHRLSCCNCARRGHDSTTCASYRWSRHFPTPAHVTNYTTGPHYPFEYAPEDIEHPTEARGKKEADKRHAEDDTAQTSSPRNQGKKRRSNVNNVTSENEDIVKVSQRGSKNVDRNDESVEDQAKEQSNSNRENTQESSGSAASPKNSKTANNGEIFLTLKSDLLGDEDTREPKFSRCGVPLSVEQYEILMDDLGREFLQNLMSLCPIKLEFQRSEIGNIKMVVKSAGKFRFLIQQAIKDWFNWPFDERNRFVKFSLPQKRKDLVILLTQKLDELKQDLGDPFELSKQIQDNKHKLKHLKLRSVAGKKMSTCSKRARIVEKLATMQCRLNMILFGQAKDKKLAKSHKSLKNSLKILKKDETDSNVAITMYLHLVHHYNKIFAAYTPDDLDELLNGASNVMSLKLRAENSSRKLKQLVNRNKDSSGVEFIKSVNLKNKNQNIESPASPEEEVAPETPNRVSERHVNSARKDPTYADFLISINSGNEKASSSPASKTSFDQVLQQNVNSEREDSSSANCNGVESQFVVPGVDYNGGNHPPEPNSTPAEPPSLFDLHLQIVENDYCNLQQDFGDNSGLQIQENEVRDNYQADDYIALNTRGLRNDYYNARRNFGNVGSDFMKYSRRRNQERYTPRNRMNRTVFENGYQSSPVANWSEQSNSSLGRNQWHQDYNLDVICPQDMFFTDTQATESHSSRNYSPNDTTWNDFSRNRIEEGNIQDLNGPSTSGARNQLRIHPDNYTVPSPDKISSKNKKKKKNKGESRLPPYLQQRASKNIAKYIDLGNPQVTQAAKELQKKLNAKDLTLKCVTNFERLVKRKLKKTDHLL